MTDSGSQPHRILVADDNVANRELLEAYLAEVECELETSVDGQDTLDKVESFRPDLVLLDVMMPDLDGLATVAQLQANAATRDIPVILLTAKAQASDRRQYYAAGVKGVITKPFDPTTLASQIAGFLGWSEFA